MKQRLLVMNGQRLIQTARGGEWDTEQVSKAGNIKPGIYNIHLATEADKSKIHDGIILHADKEHVFQQSGKDFVKHNRENFDKVPDIGSLSSIKYGADTNKAVVSAAAIKLGRSR